MVWAALYVLYGFAVGKTEKKTNGRGPWPGQGADARYR